MKLVVDRLPSDADERQGVLDAYFGRRIAEAEQLSDGRWQIEVGPFDKAEMHVDPQLAIGLRWWGCEIASIHTAVRRAGSSQLSLEDSWTAFAWSNWLASVTPGCERVTVLHVDDHDDLMAPLLEAAVGNRWQDLVTGLPVDIRAPETVRAAVESGAIGVAGFFTPFLHHVASGEVRHLCASGYSVARPSAVSLVTIYQSDDLLRPGAERPAVRLALDEQSPWRYRVTADPHRWLADLPEGELLLHIDFDYFCNRFNGDSDWQKDPPPNNVALDEIPSRVDALVGALAAAGVADRVVDVSGALSPGFFPAELWEETVTLLAAGLRQLGLDVTAWQLSRAR